MGTDANARGVYIGKNKFRLIIQFVFQTIWKIGRKIFQGKIYVDKELKTDGIKCIVYFTSDDAQVCGK